MQNIKELLKLNKKKQTIFKNVLDIYLNIKKEGNDKKTHTKFSTALVINQMEIKTLMRYQYTLPEVTKIKKIDISKYQ